MLIRAATPSDVQRMIALGAAAPSAPQWADTEYEHLFNPEETRARHALVAEEQSVIAGFAIALELAPHWELETIVVDEGRRQTGIGSQLLAALMSLAKERAAREMTLEVRESNSAARGLYEQLGFSVQARRRRYYHDPEEDAIIYSVFFAPVENFS
jgi:ribosomal-protein-alanine N-acetyltransferase